MVHSDPGCAIWKTMTFVDAISCADVNRNPSKQTYCNGPAAQTVLHWEVLPAL